MTKEKYEAAISIIEHCKRAFEEIGADDMPKILGDALIRLKPVKDFSSNPVLADSLPTEQYPDIEADGIVFCGKCGTKK